MIELVRRPGYKSRLPNCQHRGISRPDTAIGFATHHLAWGSAVPPRRRGLGLGYGAAALPPPQGPSQLTAQGRLGGQRMICKFASRHRRPPLPARRFLASLSLKAATVVARPTPGDVGRAARHGGHANRRSLLRLPLDDSPARARAQLRHPAGAWHWAPGPRRGMGATSLSLVCGSTGAAPEQNPQQRKEVKAEAFAKLVVRFPSERLGGGECVVRHGGVERAFGLGADDSDGSSAYDFL